MCSLRLILKLGCSIVDPVSGNAPITLSREYFDYIIRGATVWTAGPNDLRVFHKYMNFVLWSHYSAERFISQTEDRNSEPYFGIWQKSIYIANLSRYDGYPFDITIHCFSVEFLQLVLINFLGDFIIIFYRFQ